MVSNLSSFLAYHYVSGRPAIHIVPRRDKPVERVAMLLSRFRVRRKVKADEAWMIDPADTGGVCVSGIEDTLQAVNYVLDDPRPGAEAAAAWLARHVPRLEENAAQRIKNLLLAMCATPTTMRGREATQFGPKDFEPPDCGTARAVASWHHVWTGTRQAPAAVDPRRFAAHGTCGGPAARPARGASCRSQRSFAGGAQSLG